MRLYAGIDLHSTNHVLAIMNDKGEHVFRRRIQNEVRDVQKHLLPYRDELAGIAIESTLNWYWLVDALLALGYRVHLLNPLAIKPYLGLKHQDDRSDAFFLADLLRLQIVKDGYIYPKAKRALRDLLRKRLSFMRHRTSICLSMENLFSRETGRCLSQEQLMKLNEASVKQSLADPLTQLAFFSHQRAFNFFTDEITAMEKVIHEEIPEDDEGVMRLQTIPGVGRLLSVTILLETGDIGRFPRAGNYASYCRCCERKRESNQQSKGCALTQNGNQYLAWAFVQASQVARRTDETIKAYYQKKCAKTHCAVAVKTIAHKLCLAAYYIQRRNEVFDVKRGFGER